jgi:F0F1-type ATP synthase membrane subunit b/b'
MLELDASIVVIIVLFMGLAWAVNRLYLRPVGALLEQRRQSTEGTIDEARQKMTKVEDDLRHCQEVIRQAHAENYKQQEEQRRQALGVRQQLLQQGRTDCERLTTTARRELADQTAHAKEWMAREAEALSRDIVKKLLA